jgi:hypothetical protein
LDNNEYLSLPVVPKIAVVLYGIVGGMTWRNGIGEPSNIEDCYKTLKYNILRHYNCDIFIHSWSIEHRDRIINTFNPITSLIEPQEYFGYSDKIDHSFDNEEGFKFRALSRWTSTKRAIELKTNYEIQRGFRYKWVIIPRIDLVYFTELDLTKFEEGVFYIMYSPLFGENNFCQRRSVPAIDDEIFMCSSEHSNKFSLIADDIKSGKYAAFAGDPHLLSLTKIIEILSGDKSKMRYGFKRFSDIEIYRTVINFSNGKEDWLRPYCDAMRIDMNKNLHALLKKIDGGI